MRIVKIIFVIFAFSLSACGYIKGGVEELITNPISAIEQKPQSTEVVSGSIKAQATASGYLVDSSIGSMNGTLKGVTGNGYQVYFGLQGQVITK